jgi:copper chaperone CopZ
MASAILRVPDVSCEHCERTIKQALSRTAGVRQVDVNIPGKEVRVSYDEAIVDLERIILKDEDYPVASATQA